MPLPLFSLPIIFRFFCLILPSPSLPFITPRNAISPFSLFSSSVSFPSLSLHFSTSLLFVSLSLCSLSFPFFPCFSPLKDSDGSRVRGAQEHSGSRTVLQEVRYTAVVVTPPCRLALRYLLHLSWNLSFLCITPRDTKSENEMNVFIDYLFFLLIILGAF